jgi:hypothetical protein
LTCRLALLSESITYARLKYLQKLHFESILSTTRDALIKIASKHNSSR